jgi:hypothetical protein
MAVEGGNGALSLELLPQKLKKYIPDERGDHRNFKIGSGENIFDGPGQAPLQAHA